MLVFSWNGSYTVLQKYDAIFRGLDKVFLQQQHLSYDSTKPSVVGTQKNHHLAETILLSFHNIRFEG